MVKPAGMPHDHAEGGAFSRVTTSPAPEALGMAKKFILTTLAVVLIAIPVWRGAAQSAPEPGARPEADYSTLDALYQAARQEGQVVVMAIDPRDVAWLPAAFAKAFPGVAVRTVPSSLGHLPVIINDAESVRPGLDVVMTSLMEAHALEKGGFLANLDRTPFIVPARNIGLNGRFVYTNNFVYTVSYDERRVGKEDVPVMWRDLLGPKYRGAMSSNPFIMPRLMAGLGLIWGEAEAESYGRKILDQDLLNQFGDAKMHFLNQGNPRRFFIGMPNTVTEQWEKQQQPSGYVVPEPVIMEQQGAAALATAPHPAAARLLAGWMATEEAKAIRSRDAQATDLLADSSDPLAVALRARQVPIVYDTPDTTGERARMAESFQPIYNIDPYFNPYRRRPAPNFQILPGLPN
jgi:ABC-type Fe3+ transport system substrate-binding protein